MTEPQPIHVTVNTANRDTFRIIATVLAFGGIFLAAWLVAQQGYAEKLATVLAAAIAFIATRLWSRGILGMPTGEAPAGPADADVDFLRQIGRSATAVSGGYLNRASVPMLSLIGLAYGVGFLVLREVLTMVLTMFQNIYVPIIFGLIIGSVVVMPDLFPSFFASLRRKGVIRPDVPAATQPAPPTAVPVPAPAPVATAVPAPVPAPTGRVVKKVVKKKKKKESTDE